MQLTGTAYRRTKPDITPFWAYQMPYIQPYLYAMSCSVRLSGRAKARIYAIGTPVRLVRNLLFNRDACEAPASTGLSEIYCRPLYAVRYACRDGQKRAFTPLVRLYALFGTCSLIQMCRRDACEAPASTGLSEFYCRPLYAVRYACRDGQKRAFTPLVRLYALFDTCSFYSDPTV